MDARVKPAHDEKGCMKLGGRLTSDPNRSSLGLLPSGPDPVGEWSVHRQPPDLYIGPRKPESKRPREGGLNVHRPCAGPLPHTHDSYYVARQLRPSTRKPMTFRIAVVQPISHAPAEAAKNV